jgi:hypothetical protein
MSTEKKDKKLVTVAVTSTADPVSELKQQILKYQDGITKILEDTYLSYLRYRALKLHFQQLEKKQLGTTQPHSSKDLSEPQRMAILRAALFAVKNFKDDDSRAIQVVARATRKKMLPRNSSSTSGLLNVRVIKKVGAVQKSTDNNEPAANDGELLQDYQFHYIELLKYLEKNNRWYRRSWAITVKRNQAVKSILAQLEKVINSKEGERAAAISDLNAAIEKVKAEIKSEFDGKYLSSRLFKIAESMQQPAELDPKTNPGLDLLNQCASSSSSSEGSPKVPQKEKEPPQVVTASSDSDDEKKKKEKKDEKPTPTKPAAPGAEQKKDEKSTPTQPVRSDAEQKKCARLYDRVIKKYGLLIKNFTFLEKILGKRSQEGTEKLEITYDAALKKWYNDTKGCKELLLADFYTQEKNGIESTKKDEITITALEKTNKALREQLDNVVKVYLALTKNRRVQEHTSKMKEYCAEISKFLQPRVAKASTHGTVINKTQATPKEGKLGETQPTVSSTTGLVSTTNATAANPPVSDSSPLSAKKKSESGANKRRSNSRRVICVDKLPTTSTASNQPTNITSSNR